MYLAYTIPHLKLQVPDLAQYKDKEWPENMKIQAAMISRMSKDVGRLSNLLERLKIDEKTLIIFSSDNGAHGKGETLKLFKSSGDLRGKKRDMYDGGVIEINTKTKKKTGQIFENLWMPHSIKFFEGSFSHLVAGLGYFGLQVQILREKLC